MDLVTVQGGEAVHDDFFRDVELFGHDLRIARPASDPLKILEGDEYLSSFEANLPLYGGRLTSGVPVADVDHFVR